MDNRTLSREIDRIHSRLVQCYGKPATKKYPRILDALIETILSQNTSDINSHRAYLSLKRRFPGWMAAASARPQAIEAAIRSGGLAETKSRRISKLLNLITEEQGRPSLEHLRKLSPGKAYQMLLSYDGVGPKTAACTLLFGAGMPVFPVDTHVYRVCQRLGWVNPKESAESFQERIGAFIRPGQVFDLHVNLIVHGRQTCHPRRPECRLCCLQGYCRYQKDKNKN